MFETKSAKWEYPIFLMVICVVINGCALATKQELSKLSSDPAPSSFFSYKSQNRMKVENLSPAKPKDKPVVCHVFITCLLGFWKYQHH